MEYAKSEIVVLEKIENEALENGLRELHELQLALVGGGVGEVLIG